MNTATRISIMLSLLAVVGCADRAEQDGSDEPWNGGSGEDSRDPDPGDDGEGDDESSDPGEENDPQDDPGCVGETIVLDAEVPNVVLVLDKSGSMTTNTWTPEGAGNPVTRWNSLHGVVSEVVNTFEDRINFGAALFPLMGVSPEAHEAACGVADAAEVAVAPQNGSAILSAIPAANAMTYGGTPATAGILNALDALGDAPEDEPAAMVLVTDGVANCAGDSDTSDQYDDALPQTVKDAYDNDGIATYVVGINISDDDDNEAGVNPREKLNEVAHNGGMPQSGEDAFYNVADASELNDALDAIAARVVCTIPLSTPPTRPNHVEVRIAGETVERVDDCANGNGWRFTTDQGPFHSIELCGSACTDLQAERQLETEYACPPVG